MPEPPQQRIEVYDPKIHDLDMYVELHSSVNKSFAWFKGHEMYEEMRDKGYLFPHLHLLNIRQIIADIEIDYTIEDDFRLSNEPDEYGIGDPGIHEPRIILNKEDHLWKVEGLLSMPRMTDIRRKISEGLFPVDELVNEISKQKDLDFRRYFYEERHR